jgi:hypothetical protein
METINTNIVGANAQLIYLLHDEMCAWGKGLSVKDAMANYKKVKGSRTPKKQTLSIYLCLQPLTQEEAFSEIQIDWCNQTYSSDKVILLQDTPLK